MAQPERSHSFDALCDEGYHSDSFLMRRMNGNSILCLTDSVEVPEGMFISIRGSEYTDDLHRQSDVISSFEAEILLSDQGTLLPIDGGKL